MIFFFKDQSYLSNINSKMMDPFPAFLEQPFALEIDSPKQRQKKGFQELESQLKK